MRAVSGPDPVAGQRVFLVRHGETEWSRDHRHTGRTDIPLTDEGRRQGRLVGDRLRGQHLARVLTSPSRRALETCHLAGFADGAEVYEQLREWDYGAYEGRTTAEIRAERPGWDLWVDGVPDGETVAEVGRRADIVCTALRASQGQDVVVFGHAHLLRVLAARWLEQPPVAGRFLALSPATLSVLGYEHGEPVIWRWNDGAHLEAGNWREAASMGGDGPSSPRVVSGVPVAPSADA